MAVNPDPKPGRWILPLVILGMIAFTYFFVRQLPEASPDTTLIGAPDETTTTTTTAAGTETTEPGGNELDPDTEAYLAELDTLNSELQLLGTEIVTVNDGFDNDREIEFPEAEDRFEAVAESTGALADRLGALTVPVGLEENQEALQRAMDLAADAANDALAGLRSTDTGELRRTAVEAYTIATEDFDTEVTNTKNAAGAAAA